MNHIQGVVFDLDETLLDTSSLKPMRDKRDWKTCYRSVNLTQHYNGGKEVIETLQLKGIKIGIVTNSPRKYAESVLNYHGIKPDYLVAYHDCKYKKPHPGPIEMCIQGLELSKKAFLGIGDDIRDIKAYKSAGIEAVGVVWGVHTEKELITAGADIIINSFNELLTLI
ncbi:HAD family hydrolase [Bacillus sp. PK3_68]|uniref:HAD family hydrolase n=1 Tax=Bacillus sp. PK3_68 TaxID=2027408 RepID=UPI000E752B21|nr:HAD family hydrolase [Bacillus sp. PK3_68]RJS59181.1 hypothetical protein CJ483_03120 [Bacillus sp. PK3_68]